MRLAIQERQEGVITVLTLEGALVMGEEADALRGHIKKLLKARRTNIILQLEQVARLDSVGIGTIMDGVKRTRAAGGDVYLARLSKTAADVLGLLGLAQRPELLRIFPDEQAALAAFHAD
jgi:anti-sigma B factor antagonist